MSDDLSREKSLVRGKIHTKRQIQDKQQQKTFTRWLNTYMIQVGEPKVKKLVDEMKPGIIGIRLMEALTEKPPPKFNKKPKNKHTMIENQNTFLSLIAEQGIKLVNIAGEDLHDGNLTLVLGLMWTLILHFELSRYGADESHILKWTKTKLEPYPEVEITNWGSSFNDGKAFCAIIHRHAPEVLDYEQAVKLGPMEALEMAFTVANEKFGVPRLLEPSDLAGESEFDDDDDESTPPIKMGKEFTGFDDRSIITYLAKLRQAVREHRLEERQQTTSIAEAIDAEGKELGQWITNKVAEFNAALTEEDTLSGSSLADVKSKLDGLVRVFGNDEKPPRAGELAALSARYVACETRLEAERAESAEEEKEWRERQKEPDAAGAALIGAGSVTLNQAASPQVLESQWAEMEAAETSLKAKLGSAVASRRRALMLFQRLRLGGESVLEWHSAAQPTLQDVTEGEPDETEVLRRLATVRRLIEEAHTMTETVARLDTISQKLKGDAEHGEAAAEVMESLSFVVTLIGELQASEKCLEEMHETARALAERRREYTRKLLAFGDLVEQAAEMTFFRVPSEDNCEEATTLLEAAQPLMDALAEFPPEVTVTGSADEKRCALLVKEWDAHVPGLKAIAAGEEVTEEQLNEMERGPPSVATPTGGATTEEMQVEINQADSPSSGPFAFFARAFSRPRSMTGGSTAGSKPGPDSPNPEP